MRGQVGADLGQQRDVPIRSRRDSGPLGFQTLLTLGRAAPSSSRPQRGNGFLVGALTSLGKPKAGWSLIPQFVTAGGPVLLSSIALGLLWASIPGPG